MFEEMMKNYIKSNLEIDIRPSFGIGEYPIFVYVHTPITAGHINQSQYEIKIVANDLDQAIGYRDRFIELLNLENQDKTIVFEDFAFRPSLSGGGQLYNDSIQSWELSLIFIIKWRKKNGR